MIVKELIEKLQKLDQLSEVLYFAGYNSLSEDYEYPEVTEVTFYDEFHDGFKYKFNVVVIDGT